MAVPTEAACILCAATPPLIPMEHGTRAPQNSALQRRVAADRQPTGEGLAGLVDTRVQAIAQRRLSDAIHQSPRMVAQRALVNLAAKATSTSTTMPTGASGCVQREIGDAGKSLVGRKVIMATSPIGDAGKALIGQAVIRLADGAQGKVLEVPPGMHELSPDINIFYRIQFADGIVNISAADSRYALSSNVSVGTISRFPEYQMAESSPDINFLYEVDIGGKIQTVSAGDKRFFLLGDTGASSGGPATVAKPSAKEASPAKPQAESPDTTPEATQAHVENQKLAAFKLRLGTPLTSQDIDFTDSRITLSAATRKDLLVRLQQASTPSQLRGEKALQALEVEISDLETRYASAAKDTATYRSEKEHKRKLEEKAERLKQEAEKLSLENAQALKEKNRSKLGTRYSAFAARLNDVELDAVLAQVNLADYGKLQNILPYAAYSKLLVLLGKASVTHLNDFLPALGGGKEDQLSSLLDNIQPGEEATLLTLIGVTHDDKTALISLLALLNRSATAALDLMTLGGDRHEASIVAMLNLGRSVAEIKILLQTTSGQGNAPDAATITTGVPSVADATTLLNTPGVKAHAANALLLLAHPKVGNNIPQAEALLNKKGTASDALVLVQSPAISYADALALIDTTGIKNQGADAVRCMGVPNATVANLVIMLNLRTASQLYSYLDPARGRHPFNSVLGGLQANPNQTFWDGTTGAAPAFSGWAQDLNHIVNVAAAAHVPGQYVGNIFFGNFGGLDADGVMVMMLPAVTVYHEYDLAVYVDDPSRGKRRMVVGNDGSCFFTSDHYHSFVEF